MDPFSDGSELKESFNYSNSKSFTILPKKKWIITLIILLVLILIAEGLVFLSFILTPKSDSNDVDDIKISGIDCIYTISELNTSILSPEFENKNNTVIEIYVNGTKINYTKEYSFPSKGKYRIKYILNDELYLDNMFKNIDSIQSIELKNSSNSTIKILSMKSTFEGCKNLEKVLFTESFDTSDLKSTSKLFYNSGIKELNMNKFDTNNVEDMSYMFSHCESLTSLNLSNFSTQNAINMSYMFNDLYNLVNIPINNLDTKNVKSMDFMFYNDYLVQKLNTSNFNTENVQTMKGMFYNCHNLKEVYPQSFDTKKVTNFDYMFKNCKSIRELNLTSFYTVNCSNFIEMFDGCPRMTILILEKIDNFENLLEVMLDSDVNIRFMPQLDYYDDDF